MVFATVGETLFQQEEYFDHKDPQASQRFGRKERGGEE